MTRSPFLVGRLSVSRCSFPANRWYKQRRYGGHHELVAVHKLTAMEQRRAADAAEDLAEIKLARLKLEI